MRVLTCGLMVFAAALAAGCGSLKGSPGPWPTDLGTEVRQDGEHVYRIDPDGTLLDIVLEKDTGDEIEVDSWDLVAHQDFRRFGLEVALLPQRVQRAVHGDAEPLPVVTAVRLGGPAYLAGIRRGDVVLAVDGGVVPDPRRLVQALGAVEEGHAILLSLLQPGGEVERTLIAASDLQKESSVDIPVLMRWRDRPHETEFRMAFGLLGHRYTSYWATPPEQRTPAVEKHWGLFADLIEVHTTPKGGEVTLFWLIPIKW